MLAKIKIQNSFLLLPLFFLNFVFVFAQQTTPAPTTQTTPTQTTPTTNTTTATPRTATQYNTDSLMTKASQLCARYSGYSSVNPPPTLGGGGGSVPVDFQSLQPVLLSIDQNTRLTANEMRQENLLKFCEEYQNMAAAAVRVADQARLTLKNIADSCNADEQCLSSRVFRSDIQKEVDKAMAMPLYGREVSQLIINNVRRTDTPQQSYNYELLKKCNEARAQGRNPIECVNAPKPEEIILNSYYSARDRIQTNQTQLSAQFGQGGGVVGNRPCTKTASGRDPSEVKFYEPDCISYRTEPGVVNQEAIRQIVALPYNQANAPSAVLGADGVLNNINTRIREGNLIDPNIGANFSSTAGGTTGGTGTGTGDLAAVEANYKKLMSNLDVILNLYNAAALGYASTTSVCKNLPVQTRSETITKINAAKKTYEDYKTNLKAKWDRGIATPNQSHTDLIVLINFDLKDKVNQDLINKIYDAVKALFQTCVNTAPKT